MQKRPLLALAALALATEQEGGLARLKDGLRDRYASDPIGSTVSAVLVASVLFYRAEHGRNPRVTSIYDALEYVTTSLSVGYSKIFPETPTGKLIGSTLMTFGPAAAAGLFDPPHGSDRRRGSGGGSPVAPEPGGAREGSDAVVERLDRILAALEARG